jgi:hypothetical protein
MTEPVFDNHGYPDEETLERIEQWDSMDPDGCLNFVKRAWHWPEGASHQLTDAEASIVGAKEGERHLRLATGGWSGNESLVGALRHNRLVSAQTWLLHARGGLHIYRYTRKYTS